MFATLNKRKNMKFSIDYTPDLESYCRFMHAMNEPETAQYLLLYCKGEVVVAKAQWLIEHFTMVLPSFKILFISLQLYGTISYYTQVEEL